MRRINDWWVLIGFIVLSEGAGIIGSIFTTSAIGTWYTTLTRPDLAPPNWIFGPVWTTLFFLMGVAAFLVWRQGWQRSTVRGALGIFFVQLVLNTLWSIIFFNFQALGAALIEIVVLWCAICATIAAFGKVSKPAAWLLVPYIVWVSFAAYLNYMFWVLNR